MAHRTAFRTTLSDELSGILSEMAQAANPFVA
jgi:hypothetical protein